MGVAKTGTSASRSAKTSEASSDTATGGRGSAVWRIESALLDDIAVGALAPDQRLDEVGLAERFGVSRTPVREALSRLAAQGVLAGGDRRGLRVANYSREELAQMFEAMREIEVLCARLAAQRLDLLARSRLEAAQAECRAAAKAGDRTRYLKANEALHAQIYRATRNAYIETLAADFRRRTGPFRAKKFATKADLEASALSHEELLGTIFSSDSERASHGMHRHMTESLLQVLAIN
jgi:DNA-binding GntR family transcriptional regulator